MEKHVNSMTPAEMDGSQVTTSSLLLLPSEAAALCRVTPRTWRTWHATGKVPAPIRIGRTPFWRPAELKAWIDAGCPDGATWALMRE
jgi:hypothetical protein